MITNASYRPDSQKLSSFKTSIHNVYLSTVGIYVIAGKKKCWMHVRLQHHCRRYYCKSSHISTRYSSLFRKSERGESESARTNCISKTRPCGIPAMIKMPIDPSLQSAPQAGHLPPCPYNRRCAWLRIPGAPLNPYSDGAGRRQPCCLRNCRVSCCQHCIAPPAKE